MDMKKIFNMRNTMFLFAVIIFMFSLSLVGNAAFSDLNPAVKYYDEASRMSALKIISGDDNNLFRPNSKITREQFVVALFKALGKEINYEMVEAEESAFVDVSKDRWSYKHIQSALREGIIRVNPERLFNPESEIKFAEATTMALNSVYSEKIDGGKWPESYIDKAYEIGLLKELRMQPNDKITRLEASAIFDRVWYLNDVKNNNFDYSKIDATQAGTEIIITSDSKTNKKLRDYQVQTNKGVYRVNSSKLLLDVGKSYRVFIYEDNIMAVLDEVSQTDYASIKSAVGSNVRITDFNGKFDGYVIPEKIAYYYNGSTLAYSQVREKLGMCSSIVFAYNKEKSDYAYAVIIDPVYSEPHTVTKNDIKLGSAGLLKESDTKAIIIRDGNVINFKDIEERDVVYKVNDIQGKNSYYLVMNSRVEGKITDVKPNVLAPGVVQINGADYDLGDRFPVKKLDTSIGAFSKGSYVQLLMGYDNKVADIYDTTSDVAMVINTTIRKSELKADNKRVDEHFVKLISTDGSIIEYKAQKDYLEFKGKLVNFSLNKNNLVELEKIEFGGMMSLKINRDEKKINERYAADNIKLFNIISNNTNVDADIQALRWSDIPSGDLPWERVLHMSISGDFEDVVLIVFSDLFEDNYKLGYVKDNPNYYNLGNERATYNSTVYIDGTGYNYSAPQKNVDKGEVYRVLKGSTAVTSVVRKLENKVEAEKIDAYDSRRIKLNGTVYPLSNKLKVVSINKNNALTLVNKDEINIAKEYSRITAFVENEFGTNKVIYMVMQE
jgi:hypothetical protein